jgi:predicted O-methyltransferase YrrM
MALLSPSDAAHLAVRNGRRLRGRYQLQGLEVSGTAPSAVVRGLRKATLGLPTAEEKAWIERIELLRSLLLTSPRPLQIEDFGAGSAVEADSGVVRTEKVSTRTLGTMTRSSKPPRWAYLLFRLIREVGPVRCVEMGACVGISAAYQAAALELNGRDGRLLSLEGADVLAERSARSLEELGLDGRAEIRLGRFSDTLDAAVTELKPVDWAFIDGDHQEEGTLAYMEQVLAAAGDEAVLVFDDINWSGGMRSAWRRVVADDRFALTVDLRSVGLAVVSKSATGRRDLEISYY